MGGRLRRVAGPAALGCAMALAACSELKLPGLEPDQAPTEMVIARGAITAKGPPGFCVAPRASGARRGFAMLAACGALNEGADFPGINGLITVQAGRAGSAGVSASEPALAALLETPDGAALLSASGEASTVAVGTTRSTPGVVTVTFTDSNPPMLDGTQGMQWRAFTDIAGRMVTVTVRGLAARPLSDTAGQTLLRQALVALSEANGAAAAAPPT